MKKAKTFFTLLGLAGIITAVTLTVSNSLTTHLEKELALKANQEILKTTLNSPLVSATPKPVSRPTLPPSPSPEIPETTPLPTPKKLRLVLPATGAEVLADYTEDMPVFQETYGDYRTHLGIDFGGDETTPVYAACDGIITKNDFDYERGYTVEIAHDDGYVSRYSNLSDDKSVAVGQVVLQGEPIGTMGASGIWESHLPCHLHFELEQEGMSFNPQNYLYHSFQ